LSSPLKSCVQQQADSGNPRQHVFTAAAARSISPRACLPSSFTPLIESDRFIRRCRPVWRNERRGGVAFD
jgi:hypothetical protein